jgi:coenzyme Q-binding protein COQ10
MVPYSAEEMFALVADIERYPDFLPWCVALRIAGRKSNGDIEYLNSEMVVAYRVFREKFRSLVRLDCANCRIDVDYVDGPFRSLKNGWAFRARPDGGSIVDFSIDFEFRNLVLQATAQAVFERAFLKMSEAFVERAKSVYGGQPSFL